MNWEEILKYFISVTAITTSIIFIGRTLFTKFIEAGIEKYKTTLSKDLELYKSKLERTNTEYQIKYNKLYEQRGEKIQQLYQIIYDLEKKLKLLTSAFQGLAWSTDTKRSDAVRRQLDDLNESLELNRIYFGDALCERVESIIRIGRGILGKMHKAKMIQRDNDELYDNQRGHEVINPNEPLDSWLEAGKNVEIELKNARLELVKEFHELIGVK